MLQGRELAFYREVRPSGSLRYTATRRGSDGIAERAGYRLRTLAREHEFAADFPGGPRHVFARAIEDSPLLPRIPSRHRGMERYAEDLAGWMAARGHCVRF